jgi:ADP-ribose pyrophosphatase YjhB (NUDIX family)
MQENRILLVNHGMYGNEGYFWSPPGGGIAFGEPAHEALVREFREETGLFVKPGRLLFVNEHIQSPLHAIELFFEIEFFDGTLLAGTDPELTTDGQIIRGVRFMTWEELTAFSAQQRHRIFSQVTSLAGILELNKYIAGENGRSND